MTAAAAPTTSEQRAPSTVRKPVLNNTPEALVELLQGFPGYWRVIAHGEADKRGTLSQTGYRIRHGYSKAFKVDPSEGSYEIQVSSDRKVLDRKHPVELFARWIPAGRRGMPDGEDGLVPL